MSTAAKFNRRLHDSIVQCISLGYRPSDFIEMLDKTEGVTLAKKLVATGAIQSGLKRVKALGRPELAMESIMLEDEFSGLFTDDERAAARWRLQQL
jgi:hypothetical protein